MSINFLSFTEGEFEAKISGPYEKVVWGKTTNLKIFRECIPDLDDAEFIQIRWMNVREILESPSLRDSLHNTCIRQEDSSTKDSRVSIIRGSLEKEGWNPKPSESMIVVASNGPGCGLTFEEGRGRTYANMHDETPQEWIPVAEFRKNNLNRDALTNSLRNGFLTNLVDKPKTPPKMDDYVPALTAAIGAGVVNNTIDDLKRYLLEELLFGIPFPHPSSATKTANKALESRAQSQYVLKHMELADVSFWGAHNPRIKNLTGKVFYIRACSRKATNSALEEILQFLVDNPEEHVYIVFYTTKTLYSTSQKRMKTCEKRINEWWKKFHQVAFKTFFPSGQIGEIPDPRYTILGCVPQYKVKHKVDGNALVPVNQY